MSINRNYLWIALTFPISLIYAAQDNIPCASVSLIRTLSQQIDTALLIQNKYISYSSTPVFEANDLWWFIGIGDIVASSTADALRIGKTILSNTDVQLDRYATQNGNEFICNYGPGYIQARGKKLY